MQWVAARNPFCAYGSHNNVEFHSLEPSQYYPVVLLRFLAYQEMLDSLPPGRCALCVCQHTRAFARLRTGCNSCSYCVGPAVPPCVLVLRSW